MGMLGSSKGDKEAHRQLVRKEKKKRWEEV